ncbi:sigma-E factor negative regulatory protein [SAR86 cluster bacterium]|nr:sigma-E factor negative regulatory protein [SAR86 cluster bacterium]
MIDNKIMKEKVSALADGELSDFEIRRILTEISSNPEYREFWKNIHQSKEALRKEESEFLDIDVSSRVSFELDKVQPKNTEQIKKHKYPQASYIVASIFGFCAVIIYYLIPSSVESFSDIASQRIVDAIDSPQSIEVLNNSVSELGILQDFKSNQKGTLANYRVPNSNKTFKVSLYPIKEVNKIGIGEATRISYIKSKKGIYVVSVSGNISAEEKNQILQNANFFAEKIN